MAAVCHGTILLAASGCIYYQHCAPKGNIDGCQKTSGSPPKCPAAVECSKRKNGVAAAGSVCNGSRAPRPGYTQHLQRLQWRALLCTPPHSPVGAPVSLGHLCARQFRTLGNTYACRAARRRVAPPGPCRGPWVRAPPPRQPSSSSSSSEAAQVEWGFRGGKEAPSHASR